MAGAVEKLHAAGWQAGRLGGFVAQTASSRVVPGCEVLALAITGQPAAMAAAKSPPAMLLNANGKLFGPNTSTGPSAAWQERIFSCVSIVGSRQLPLRGGPGGAAELAGGARQFDVGQSRFGGQRRLGVGQFDQGLAIALDIVGEPLEKSGDELRRCLAKRGGGRGGRVQRGVDVGPSADRENIFQRSFRRGVFGLKRAAGLRSSPAAGDQNALCMSW